MEPEKKTLSGRRGRRVICETVQHVLFDVETQPSDRDACTLLLLPHFQAVLLRGGLRSSYVATRLEAS